MTEPPLYERGKLYQKLSEVEGFLAELRYVDRALAYLSEHDAHWWESTPLYDNEIHMEIELGTTFPFTRWYSIGADELNILPWEESPADKVTRQLRELADEAAEWAADEIASLAGTIEPFASMSASSYDSFVIEPLNRVHEALQDDVDTDFGLLNHSLGNWEGDAADNFASYFYNPFADTLETQRRLVVSLIAGVGTAKAIIESTQHSLMNTVHHIRDALHEQLQLRQQYAEMVGQETARSTLIIAGETVSIVAAIFGGSLWAIGVATATGAAQIASGGVPDSAHALYEMKGATAQELATALSDAVREIDRNHSYQQDELADAVRAVLERAEVLRGGSDGTDGRLIPARPHLVDGVDGDDFYLPPPVW